MLKRRGSSCIAFLQTSCLSSLPWPRNTQSSMRGSHRSAGPTIPNRVFAHFGTSFGKVDNSLFYINAKYHTIYERMVDAGRTAKIYYFDDSSSTIALAFLLLKQPKLFGTFDDFLHDCKSGKLPDYSFVEPNYKDHEVEDGMAEESDQHPDGNVHVGEGFIKAVYQAIRSNQQLWESSALLIVYDEHGG